MEKYYYKCFDCGKEYTAKEIENNLVYLCPACGLLQKNMPLRGVLLIKYDYKSIKKKHSAAELLNSVPGSIEHYNYLLPLKGAEDKIKGIKKSTPGIVSTAADCLKELESGDEKFLILDDTRNPTLSFKDRATSLVVLKAIQMGIKKIAAASTGNAGSSLAGICARVGIESVVFVPKNIPEAKRIQIQSYGAQVVVVEGDYDLAFDTCLEVSQLKGWYSRNTAYNPLTIEGKKTAAYDIFISTGGKIPDVIFIPVGDGVIIAGLYKGFSELKELGWIKKMPKLIAVQASGSDAVARYIKKGSFRYKPASSVADSICAGAPRNLLMAAESVLKTGGEAVRVTDKEIIAAQKTVAARYGILIEPSSAAAYAGYKKYFKTVRKEKKSLLLFTGNGLKDTSALLKWNTKVTPQKPDAIIKKYKR